MIDRSKLPDDTKISEIDRLIILILRYTSYRCRFQERVASTNRRFATAIFATIVSIIQTRNWFLLRFAPTRYTDADPYKLLMVDPADIKYTTGDIYSKRRGWVVDGTWDTEGIQYMDRPNPKAIKQRFVDGKAWEETTLAEKFETTKFEKRTKSINHLYEAIREKGYKSQRQLLEEHPDAAWSGLNDAMHPLANEVGIDIGRNGELLWNICGQHRLAIAKVLEVDQIPVQVFRRHSKWQEIRNKAHERSTIPAELHDHPDLQDVLDKQTKSQFRKTGQ